MGFLPQRESEPVVEKLCLVLWRERELLDTLLYRLEVEQLVLASNRTEHLMRAARDVEAVLETLRETEVLRATAADAAAAEIGLPPAPTLRQLAEAATEPWATMLHEHREAFESSTRQITALADSNRDLLTHGYRQAREALAGLAEPTESYSPDGTAVGGTQVARLFDSSI
jgi:hypothetical protein